MSLATGTAGTLVERDADRLIAVIQDLSAARSLDEVQRIVRTAARQLAAADGATFVLRDGDRCYYADEDAIQPLWKGKRFPMSACISGWAMLHREVVVLEDIYVDPRIPADVYRPTFVKSLLMTPIRTDDPIGAIGVYWARTHRADERQMRLLQALANSTSIAIANISLLAELQAAKDAAESANRLKDEFLATVSHELLTPLTPLLSCAELLAQGSLAGAAAREAIAVIRTSAQWQAQNVGALLDGSKMLAGTLSIRRTEIDPARVVRDAIDVAMSDAVQAGVELRDELAADAGSVSADPERLRQIAGNLLSNAIKFTPRGGCVTVTLSCSGGQCTLVVEDTGRGIVPEFLPRLFTPFRQHDGSMTRAAGGLGLGLALVRHVVELHGGTIEAQSPGANAGSTFTVRLPVGQQ